MRQALALLSACGCAAAVVAADAPAKKGTDTLPVTVSAVNYSQLTDAELFDRVNNPEQDNPDLPQAPKSAQPLYYLALPGEVYPTDVTPDAVYRELEASLEKRNYFNAVYQEKAGHKPPRIDYLLRIHYGVRPWLIPSVRADRITWGDDGLVANSLKVNLISAPVYDPRTGMSQDEASRLRLFSLSLKTMGAAGSKGTGAGGGALGASGSSPDLAVQQQLADQVNDGTQTAHPFCLIVVEAFKFDEVKAQDKKARCTWATFIAIPIDNGQKFSSVLHTMMQTATPYFGGTTNGIQLYEVPPGKVLIGAPVEVSATH
jgi:hypothetical protein